MKDQAKWLAGLGLGAWGMYLFDPVRGRRRRAITRDRVVHGYHKATKGMDVAARDLAHRTQGVAAKARRRFLQEVVDDDILIARVRSRLGRLVSHPHAIETIASGGKVTLRGLVLDEELPELISRVGFVSGVQSVENQLKVYRRDDRVPALQGGRMRQGERFELMQNNWSPAARILVGSICLVPLYYGLKVRGRIGYVLSGLGAGFLARAATNIETRRLFGIGEKGLITVHKTININASKEDVFRFWSEFDNFSQFLPDVFEVREVGQNRSHWMVSGPAGIPVRWNAITTRFEPGHLLSWRSEPGAIVQNSGRIQFISNEDGSTKVEMDFTYKPPVGALGHALARAFGADPKSKLDDNLLRIKSLIENGPSAHVLRVAAR